jgi:hypothetical protein
MFYSIRPAFTMALFGIGMVKFPTVLNRWFRLIAAHHGLGRDHAAKPGRTMEWSYSA